jgi:dual specificity phosphatase 12
MPPSISQIMPHLFLGNAASSINCDVLRSNGITAIVSLLEERYEHWTRPENQALVPPARHLFVPCRDTASMDMLAHFGDICDFIEAQLATVTSNALGTVEGSVLVHCQLGYSRSPTAVVAYLMRKRRKGLDVTLKLVNAGRGVRPLDSFLEQLRVWEATEYEVWEDEQRMKPKREYKEYLERMSTGVKLAG